MNTQSRTSIAKTILKEVIKETLIPDFYHDILTEINNTELFTKGTSLKSLVKMQTAHVILGR